MTDPPKNVSRERVIFLKETYILNDAGLVGITLEYVQMFLIVQLERIEASCLISVRLVRASGCGES